MTKKPRTKSPIDIRVIDNFLPTNEFITIKDLFVSGNAPWYRAEGISGEDSTNALVNPLDNHYFAHLLYLNYLPRSDYWEQVHTVLHTAIQQHLGVQFRAITRIKANMYTRTEEVQVHPFHVDSADQSGLQGMVLSLNTCDGYTGFLDGTEVDSVENRAVFFDSTKKHHSTSTSNAPYRMNINVNWL